jgi:hypothetical protein
MKISLPIPGTGKQRAVNCTNQEASVLSLSSSIQVNHRVARTLPAPRAAVVPDF